MGTWYYCAASRPGWADSTRWRRSAARRSSECDLVPADGHVQVRLQLEAECLEPGRNIADGIEGNRAGSSVSQVLTAITHPPARSRPVTELWFPGSRVTAAI